MYPFLKLGTYITGGISGFTEYFSEYDRLRTENEELRSELADAKDKIADAEAQSEENEWLKLYLGLRREHTDYEMTAAMIISRQGGGYAAVFTLDKGSANGITVNMPVITERGIVGYVTETGLTFCRVSTLLDTSAAVGVYAERSGVCGIVQGDFSLAGEGLCVMSGLSADADIKEGDRILSGGEGSVYPRGLVVGTVVSVYPDEYSRGLCASVTPAADISGISNVMIVRGFTVSED